MKGFDLPIQLGGDQAPIADTDLHAGHMLSVIIP
jgi:hypothetical protein